MQTVVASSLAKVRENLPKEILGIRKKSGNEFSFYNLLWTDCLAQFFVFSENGGQ